MYSFLPGMAVEVNKVGHGKIVKVTRQNAIVSIDLWNDLRIQRPLTDIKPLSDERCSDVPDVIPLKDRHREQSGTEYSLVKKTIEALRFGVVPEHHIKELTIGVEELSNWSGKCLDKCLNGMPCGFEISAPYGTGKSHTLSLIRYLAREKGFLTVRAELDGQNISLSNPEVLLKNLWASLPENNIISEEPLIEIYLKVINSGKIPSKIIKRGNDKIKNNLTNIYTILRSGHLDKYIHILGAIVSSSDEYTPVQAIKMIDDYNIDKSILRIEKMIGRSLDSRASDFIESLAGHAILAKLAGYKGIIVTLDEFEVDITGNNIRLEETLRAIYNYFRGNTDYVMAPLGVFFAAVNRDGHEGDPLIEKYAAFNKESRYRLQVFNRTQRVVLAKKICSIYCEAYSLTYKFNSELIDYVENLLEKKIENEDSGLIRYFIKWYLSLLDVNYGPPKGQISCG